MEEYKIFQLKFYIQMISIWCKLG